MAGTRAFISFDYDHDSDLRMLLVGQSKHSDSPFAIADWSIKVASPGWKDEARRRIRACDVVVVVCGQHTHTASGVSVELTIAQEEKIPYFLLKGRTVPCTRPTAAKAADKMYDWTWPNLKALIGGGR